MAINFLLKRSAVASKRPTAAQLDIGELSLNYDQGTPGLFFEDDAGSVRKIGPTEVGGSAPNASPAGQSGNSIGEMWLDNSGTALLKTWDGSAWQVAGATTIGSTSIALGATSTTLAGLTSVTSTNYTASTAINLSNQADLKFFEASGNGSNYVGFQAPSAIGADVLWTLPNADGSAGQVLKTDGAGTLSWVAPSTATAAGSDTQVQYNSSGSFAGSANLTFDGTTVAATGLSITGTSVFRAAAAQDGVVIEGRAGGSGDYDVKITPAALTADRTLTLPDATGTVAVTANKLSAFAPTTSAELAGVISDETGSGALVFATSPSLTTPILGVATATSINKVTITAPATSATLTIANGKTLTVSNTLTFTGTDSSSVAFGAGGTVAYTSNKLSAFASTTSAELAGAISDETGSGSLVFGTSPSFTTSATFANRAEARFAEASANGTNYVALRGPSSVASNITWTLPTTDGTSGQALVTDGSGGLSFATVSADFGQSVKAVASNTTIPTQAGYNQVAFYTLDINTGVTVTISAGEVFTIYP